MKTMEEAAQWLARVREQELSEAERERFAKWLAESPVHVREYLQAGELWAALQSPNLRPAESKEHLLAALRQDAQRNVLPLDSSQSVAAPNRAESVNRSTNARRWLAPLTLAASVAAIALWMWPGFNGGSDIYDTARGEQRSVVLSDGSVVQLNTLTRMIVRFDEGQRRIELPQGQAFFRVAHDRLRPFSVKTPFATVRAVGTEFDVHNSATGTHVSVLEGKVVVKSLQKSTSGAMIVAGQQLMVSRDSSSSPTSVDDVKATAWMQRRVVLDDDSVAAAIAEFNRYNTRQIEVAEPTLAALRITGVFSADDPHSFIQYLREVHGIRVAENGARIVLSK